MAVESLLTFAAKGILTKLTSLAAQEIILAWGFKAELNRLRKSLSTIQGYLNDVAHQPPGQGRALEGWLKQLKDIAHDADNVLDEFQYELVRRKVELQNHMKKKVLNFFNVSNPIAFRLKMAHKIKKINASLVDLKKEASFIGLASKKLDATPQGIRWDRQTDSFPEKDGIVVGRDKVVSDVVTTLTTSDINQEILSVMVIVGMPGLGKTTLAKSVYNRDSTDKYFEKKIWVCVSDTFEVKVILICILESLNPTKATVRESQDALLKYLQEELKDKRYLLVLDDVWNEDSRKWNHLMSCLSKLSSARGSKIIVTTRSAKVASISETLPRHNLENLSVDDCWSILKDKAFSDRSAHIAHDLQSIGMEIAENCAGVPLVAKVVGGLLRSKNSIAQWLSIKQSRIWDLPEGEDRIISVLKLSFDNLRSPSLKQCFAYCSVFMKDFEIERDNLIQLWMAQGLLHPCSGTSNLEMEDIGNEYFDILFETSLFQDATFDDYGVITKCKMHDLVHDLAELVSKSESLMGDFHETDNPLEIRHLARVSTSKLERIPDICVGRLRSLFSDGEVPTNILRGFKALRVLSLSSANIEELPTSIGKLKHLRYLDISRTRLKTLPKSIGKLYNLQTLIATDSALKEFPKELLSLINLRHIYFDRSTKFPRGIGRLTCLRTLHYFYVGKEIGRQIEELTGLNQLKGEFIIYQLENVRDGEEAKKAKLEEKRKVRHLGLVWTKDWSRTSNDEDVLQGLQPHLELESLRIENFQGAKFPSWMMSVSLPLNNLKKIELCGCNGCEGAPALGHLPNLRALEIDRMANLKYVGAEFYGYDLVQDSAATSKETMTLFPALKQLHINECRELIEWMEAPTMSTRNAVVFPCLEDLYMYDCCKLRNAPSHFPSLQKLEISGIDSSRPIEKISSELTTLTSLSIEAIKELTVLPQGMLKKNNNLVTVNIRNCFELTSIGPDVFGCCASLRTLVVERCGKLRRLPDGLGTLPLLEELTMKCTGLEFIPITQAMKSLRELRIIYCHGLSGTLNGLEYCTSLQVLIVRYCHDVTSIPLHTLTSLRILKIKSCEGLSGVLSSGLEYCTSLQELRIWACDNLTSIQIPHGLSLPSLQKLRIGHCDELSSLPALEQCPSLRKLSISECANLTSISSSISPGVDQTSTSTSLEKLRVQYCTSLQYFPDLRSFTSLRTLRIEECERLDGLQMPVSLEELKIRGVFDLETLPSLDNLTSLCDLEIYNCWELKYLPTGLRCSTRLKTLSIGGYWEELESFPEFEVRLLQLERLCVMGWPKLKSLPQQIQHFNSLTLLLIFGFSGLEALPEWLGNLTSLTSLIIRWCKNLLHLPTVEAMQRLTKLQELVIFACPLLEQGCTKDSGAEWPKISHIPEIRIKADE